MCGTPATYCFMLWVPHLPGANVKEKRSACVHGELGSWDPSPPTQKEKDELQRGYLSPMPREEVGTPCSEPSTLWQEEH